MSLDHDRLPGVLYQGKIYMLNNGNGNEAMDIQSKTWSAFPPMKSSISVGSCAFVWKQSLIVVVGPSLQVSS